MLANTLNGVVIKKIVICIIEIKRTQNNVKILETPALFSEQSLYSRNSFLQTLTNLIIPKQI